MAEVWTRPLKGISIQTAPALLLGLQHAANVPGLVMFSLFSSFKTLWEFEKLNDEDIFYQNL